MEEKVIFETSYYKITHYELSNFIHFKRMGFNTITQIQEASEKFLATILQTGAKKYIVDDSETRVTPQDAQNWLTQEFIQKIPDFITKIAFVQSQDIFQQAVFRKYDKIMNQFSEEKKVTIQFFENPESAKNWMNT